MDLNNRIGGKADLRGLRTLLPLLSGHRPAVIRVVTLAGASAAAALLLYFLVGRSVAALTAIPPEPGRLPYLAAGILAAGLCGALANRAQYVIGTAVATEVTTGLQARTFDRRLAEGLERVTVNPPGRLVASILHDLPLVATFLLSALSSLAAATVTVVAVCGAVLLVDPWLFAVLAVLAFLVVPYRWIERRMRRAAVTKIQEMSLLQVFLEQRFALSGVKFARNFGLARPIREQFGRHAGRLEGATAQMQRMTALAGSLTTAAYAGFVAVVVVLAGVGPLAGEIQPGEVVVLALSVPLLIGVLQTYSTIGYWISTAVAIVDSLGVRLGRPVLTLDPPAVEAAAPAVDRARPDPAVDPGVDPGGPAVVVRDLRYRYPPTRFGASGREVLKGVSLKLRDGELVAVVGEVGCGKSTLALLMAGLLAPTAGRVAIRRRPGDTGRAVLLVDNNDHLFSTTLEKNLQMVDPTLTLRRIIDICRAVGVHDYVADLPQGYRTEIGERGMRLSSGQRQLLVLARALAARPAALVLDEATSCLDSAAEAVAVAGLRGHLTGPILLVAHRLSSAMAADRVVVLQDGVVAGVGRHDELIESSTLYRRFHEMQNI